MQVADKVSQLFNKNCQIPNLPKSLEFAAGGIVSSRPVICGGNGNQHCYILRETGSWEILCSLPNSRKGLGGITVGPSKDILWVSGGFPTSSQRKKDSFFVKANGLILKGPDLSTERAFHCVMEAANGDVIVTGGYGRYGSTKYSTEVFSPTTLTREMGPSMNQGRTKHGCQTVFSKNHGNRQVAIVVGGYISPSSAELWDFQTYGATWKLRNFSFLGF